MRDILWRLTLEAEVGEEGNILSALLALGQLGKDQEAPPSLPLAGSDALQSHRQAVQVGLGHAAPPHDLMRAYVLEGEVDEGQDDAGGEDPFGDVDRDGGGDLGRPLVEDQQVDGGKGIDAVDGS